MVEKKIKQKLVTFFWKKKKKSPFCPSQQFVLLVRVKKKNIFLVRGRKEMVSGLNKFISSLNETSNVEKFCLSPWDECMFQPHIKLH